MSCIEQLKYCVKCELIIDIAEKQKIYFGEAVFLSSDFLLIYLESVVASFKNCKTN